MDAAPDLEYAVYAGFGDGLEFGPWLMVRSSSRRSAPPGPIGLQDEIGTLTPGKSADLAVVSLAGSPSVPVEDPAAAVVFGGSPERVLFKLVQGHIRYEKGVTEWHELTVAASRARARMLEVAAAEPVRELP